MEFLLYYIFIFKNNKKLVFNINFFKKLTITQLIFASNYIQYLLQEINILNKILKMKSLLYYNISFFKKRYVIKTINLLNLCILNNIQPQ